MKKCSKCGEVKNLDNFHKDRQKRDNLRYWCKNCVVKTQRLRKERNPEHVKRLQRNNDLKKLYNISQSDYASMLFDQECLCSICRRAVKLVVDHDHKTGKVRSLLCDRCNRVLGIIEEDLGLLKNIEGYLKLHNGRKCLR